MLLNEGVVCERNSLPAYPGLSSLQDELTNRFQVGKSVGKIIMCLSRQQHKFNTFDLLKCNGRIDSPPGNVGLHQPHHGHGGLVDFDEGPAEDLPQPEHVDHLHHFGTDTFDPKRKGSSMFVCFEHVIGVIQQQLPISDFQ